LFLAPAGIVLTFRAVYLLALSYGFYLSWSRTYLLLLIVASAIVYGVALGIVKSKTDATKSAVLAFGMAAIVVIIVVFKAAGAWKGILGPLGLSYTRSN
jgi:hypothetical protein